MTKPLLEKSKQSALEQSWQFNLERRRLAGEIIAYRYEPWEFILVPKIPGTKRKPVKYTPDFLVVTPQRFEIHEVKDKELAQNAGKYREAITRVRMAADMNPWFRWLIIWGAAGRWEYEELN